MRKELAGVLFALFAAAGTLDAQSELLRNGGFESDTLGQLTYWLTDSYIDTDNARRVFTIDAPVHSGERSLVIVNLEPNDTRVVQWVSVEPAQYYRISCWVRAENVLGGAVGANISILGSITPSDSVKDTADRWVKLELVGKTGSDQTALAVCLRLGFYDNLAVGRVAFDDVTMEKIEAPPAGGKAVDFSSNRGTGFIHYRIGSAGDEYRRLSPAAAVLLGALSAALLAAAFIFGLFRLSPRTAFSAFRSGLSRLRAWPSAARGAAGRRNAPTAHAAAPELRRAARKSLRVSVTVKKKLQGGDYTLIELKTVNVSETGVFLHADDLTIFSVGERLELGVVYKRARYDLGAARVVRKQETHRGRDQRTVSGFGLEFIETSGEQRENIRALLR